jgi:hypothetical protein
LKKTFFLTFFYLTCSFAGSAQQFFSPQEEPPDHVVGFILGSPMLFRGFVKAKVISHNKFFDNDSMFYNLDKQSQKLLVTLDGKTVYKFDKREFNSVIFNYEDTSFTFEHVPAINSKDLFFAVVKTADKYSLYKYIRIENRNFAYVQWETYYILFPFPNAKFLRLKILNKKLIERAFALSRDSQKIETFYSIHRANGSKELFLKQLVEYLNQSE